LSSFSLARRYFSTGDKPDRRHLSIRIVFSLADRGGWHGSPLDEREGQIADDDLGLAKTPFEFGSSFPPARQINFFGHHLEDDNVIRVGFAGLTPKTFSGRLGVGGYATVFGG
jgi:hypothetical protein